MKFRFSHEFDVAPEKFWSVFFLKEYNEDLYKQLKFSSYELLEFQVLEDGKKIKRVQKMEPSSSLPAWVRSMVPRIAYTEHNLYEKEKSSMRVKLDPYLFKGQFLFQGLYQVTSLKNNRCVRDFQGEVQISLPVVGGKLEKFVIEQFAQSEPIIIEVTKKWLSR